MEPAPGHSLVSQLERYELLAGVYMMPQWIRILALGVLLVAALPALGQNLPASGQNQQPLLPKDVDIRLDNQLYETLKLGTTLYNTGNPDACLRLYQGSLITALGFLDHRPEQQNQIRQALADLDSLKSVSDKAHALRRAIDQLRTSFKPPATLWDRLGGEAKVATLVDDLVNRSLTNPKLNFARKGTGKQWDGNPDQINQLKRRLVQFISAASGGPLRYDGRAMKALHTGMKISDAEFGLFLEDLKASAAQQAVAPGDTQELVKVFQTQKADIVQPAATVLERSLWERMGGEPVVKAVVDEFVKLLVADPKVNMTRQGKTKRWDAHPDNQELLKTRLVQWISSVSGGPIRYAGRDLKIVHDKMQISDAEFEAFMANFKVALDRSKIAFFDKDDLIKKLTAAKADIVEKK